MSHNQAVVFTLCCVCLIALFLLIWAMCIVFSGGYRESPAVAESRERYLNATKAVVLTVLSNHAGDGLTSAEIGYAVRAADTVTLHQAITGLVSAGEVTLVAATDGGPNRYRLSST